MPAVRDEGICLRHWDWSETSQTVSLFGRSLGVMRGLAKGARRERGSFGGGIDLMARGAFGAIVKSGSELATLTEWDLIETFPALREKLARNRAAFYAADLVLRMVPPGDPHPHLHDALVELLRTLGERSERSSDGAVSATESVRMAVALLQFQWRLLRETGFAMSLEGITDRKGGPLWFDPHHGHFSETALRGPAWRVRRETVSLLRRVDELERTPDPVNPSEPSGAIAAAAPMVMDGGPAAADPGSAAEAVDRANRLLAAYLREIIQAEPATLRDLFGNLGVPSTRPSPRSI
ncbi:MAG: DNA repair protein RecO [Phycisphaeraceae bacterium]|nr:DNA repair protein RecO [Phycisphaeraceae bacterium]